MSGTVASPEGITNPPIDDLLEKVESKYALVVYAAKRARQINTYNLEIADGMFSTPGPLIDCNPESACQVSAPTISRAAGVGITHTSNPDLLRARTTLVAL